MYNRNHSIQRYPYNSNNTSHLLNYVDSILQKSKNQSTDQQSPPLLPVRLMSAQSSHQPYSRTYHQTQRYNYSVCLDPPQSDNKPTKSEPAEKPHDFSHNQKAAFLTSQGTNYDDSKQSVQPVLVAQPSSAKPAYQSPVPFILPLQTLKEQSSPVKTSSFENSRVQRKEERYKNFRIIKKLGTGKYSEVFLAKHLQTGFLVALKVIKKAQIVQEKMEAQLAWEIKIQYLLDHPNITKLFTFFQTSTEIVLVLEYCAHGELYDCLLKQTNCRFTEREAAIYVQQITCALQHIHQNDVIHRDIKPENILLNFGQAKLADFSFCVYSPHEYRQTQCGTLIYASPEVLQGDLYDKRIDLWGLGVLSYELCFGTPPWKGEDKESQIRQARISVPLAASRDLKDFIENLVKRVSRERMSAEEAMRHPWLQQTYQQLPFFLRRNEALFR